MTSGAVLSKSECLRCAFNGYNNCGYDYSLLRAIFRHQKNNRTGYHVTDITGCLRKAWYKLMDSDYEIPYPSDSSYVFLGTMIHKLLEQSDHTIWSELPVKAEFDGIELVGTVDVYYPGQGKIVDYKTSTIVREKLPYTDHAKQVSVYAVLLKKMGLEANSAFIQYIDKTGMPKCPACGQRGLRAGPQFECSVCGYTFDWDDPGYTKSGKPRNKLHAGAWLVEVELDTDATEEFVRERLKALDDAVCFEDPPEGEPSFICNYCRYKEICPDAV